MILRVIYRDTLLLNLVKISQWVLNWLELVHQASFCPSKSSWSPSFTWNLRTSSNWISLLHPQKINMEPQKLPLYLYYVYMFYSMFLVIFEVCAIFSPPPPKRKQHVFQIYAYVHICTSIFFSWSKYTHHWWPFNWYPSPSPSRSIRSIRCSDLELLRCHALRPRGTPEAQRKKKHMETDVFFGLMWWSFNFWKNLHEKLRFFGKEKKGWNTEMLLTKFTKTG